MRLNIGCGPVQPDDWLNLDPDPQWRAMVRSIDSLAPQSVEGAVAHHVLQMIPWPDLIPWLQQVRLILRPGGYLRLSVPDLELAHLWLAGKRQPLPPIADEHESTVDGKVCMWLAQAGATRSVFTTHWLVELCYRAGYSTVGAAGWGHLTELTETSRPWPESAVCYSTGPGWLTDLDLTPDRRLESLYVDAIA